VLVVGYGNELRGDDAVGPLAARTVASWGLEGVRCLAVHQLTPELVEELAEAEKAIFIDARLGTGGTRVEELSAAGQAPGGHVSDPGGLLALCRVLHERAPKAWLVTVAAENLEAGETLSGGAREGLHHALSQVRALLES
jgi:hydrogenase maturation protease